MRLLGFEASRFRGFEASRFRGFEACELVSFNRVLDPLGLTSPDPLGEQNFTSNSCLSQTWSMAMASLSTVSTIFSLSSVSTIFTSPTSPTSPSLLLLYSVSTEHNKQQPSKVAKLEDVIAFFQRAIMLEEEKQFVKSVTSKCKLWIFTTHPGTTD